MNTDLVKGFKDYTDEEAVKREEIRKILVETFERYGFEPAETPIIEYEEFVKGENEKDEAVSDIFKLKDKGKRNLALRYEFTFQLKRLVKNKKLPYRRYQIGSVFRDEPVQGNRFRQFTQADVDVVGTSNSGTQDGTEILRLTSDVLNKLGIKFVIYFNNRKLLNEILNKEKIKKIPEVIKEFDKLDKLSEKEIKDNLKRYEAEKILDIIKKPKDYFKRYESYKEIEEFEKYCKLFNVNVKFSPSLARGLSYYNGTIFEIKSNIKETICAGGSYEVNGIQSTGISFGLDRISQLAKVETNQEKILVISLNKDKEAIKLAQNLRDENKVVAIFYGKPSKALEYANSQKIDKVIFVGEKETSKSKFKVKDMKSGKESLLKI